MRQMRRQPMIRMLVQSMAGLLLLCGVGCATRPMLIPSNATYSIDRAAVAYPQSSSLQTVVRKLTCPTAICLDEAGALIIADHGLEQEPRIYGFGPTGVRFDIYPHQRGLLGSGGEKHVLRGPVGGMVAADGKIFVFHRDKNDRGMISSFDYRGNRQTVIDDLPCPAEQSVLDLAIGPEDRRLYFAIGAVTNSGVVGLDNWKEGWLKEHQQACDTPAVPHKLLGYRFDTPNPEAGFLGGKSVAVTGPFQPFGMSRQTWAMPPANGRPTGAIYSVSPAGDDLRVEAHGIRCARGLAFNDYGRLYATNQGMELRGTRPVRNDPDSLLRIIRNTWYGWPDYTTDLRSVADWRFQPPTEMIVQSGYPELSPLIDIQTSGLLPPNRDTLVQGVFAPFSGAAKMDFVPAAGPLKEYQGSAVVALWGDRAPFATSGGDLPTPTGYKVVRIDVDSHKFSDLVYNRGGLPASRAGRYRDMLERPVDVKFASDGSMFILDMGEVKMDGGRLQAVPRTGKIFRLDWPRQK